MDDDHFRWTAPEIITATNEPNDKSDVWSFGVTLWEMFNMGERPYSEEDNGQNVLDGVLDGRSSPLVMPSGMPTEMAKIATLCLQIDPSQRPHFHEITTTFNLLFRSPIPFSSKGKKAANVDSEHHPMMSSPYHQQDHRHHIYRDTSPRIRGADYGHLNTPRNDNADNDNNGGDDDYDDNDGGGVAHQQRALDDYDVITTSQSSLVRPSSSLSPSSSLLSSSSSSSSSPSLTLAEGDYSDLPIRSQNIMLGNHSSPRRVVWTRPDTVLTTASLVA
eukprot:TRINITY_DN1594_c0_g2_i2.p1 TRINITY_DN1594_c0_g2~~TRINITY_DN1594_c0_g2_i2.p1  ORF type:complete len:291 (-),score=62.74 TRINITY_DN1594_c0_g2_i2:36-860(-)